VETTQTTQSPVTQPTEPSKSEQRRAKEKELRQAKKPDYRSAGVTMRVLKPNPKKVGSNAHAVFSQYKDGLSVADLMALAEKDGIRNAKDELIGKGYVGACLMWDDRHGFIELVAPTKPQPAAPVTEQPKQS